MDDLLRPPPVMTPYLEQFRFWIWLQFIALRLYVRSVKGRGVPFMTWIDRNGTVHLDWIGKPPSDLPEPDEPSPFAFTPSRAFTAALSGDAMSACPFRSPRRTPGPSNGLQAFAALAPGMRRGERTLDALPLPET